MKFISKSIPTFILKILSGPFLGLIAYFLCQISDFSQTASLTAAVTMWCAGWWLFEPVPMAVTAMLPMILFPALGILEPKKQIAASYGHPLILLFLGGFLLSKSLETSGAHRRLAVSVLKLSRKGSPRILIMLFMVISAFLSMWISNTATVLMLLPMALAILGATKKPELYEVQSEEHAADQDFAKALLLGIAYAASVGGLATPIGTPPNGILIANYARALETDIGFGLWMTWILPLVFILLPITWLWLTRQLKSSNKETQLPELGAIKSQEIRAMAVFGVTALLWMTRTQPFGGWAQLIKEAGINSFIHDSTVALGMCVLLFLIPAGAGTKKRLLSWEEAMQIPWGILILFAGGLTIAAAFDASGLSAVLASKLSVMESWPIWLIILVLCLGVTFLTEVTSNTATASVLMPVLISTADAMGVDPRLLMIPAALSCSCAFMLPVATPPNAIVYSSGRITIRDMMREGVILNLIGACAITAYCYFRFG